MPGLTSIKSRLERLENKTPASQNRITQIIRQIVNPDGSYGKQIIREISKLSLAQLSNTTLDAQN